MISKGTAIMPLFAPAGSGMAGHCAPGAAGAAAYVTGREVPAGPDVYARVSGEAGRPANSLRPCQAGHPGSSGAAPCAGSRVLEDLKCFLSDETGGLRWPVFFPPRAIARIAEKWRRFLTGLPSEKEIKNEFLDGIINDAADIVFPLRFYARGDDTFPKSDYSLLWGAFGLLKNDRSLLIELIAMENMIHDRRLFGEVFSSLRHRLPDGQLDINGPRPRKARRVQICLYNIWAGRQSRLRELLSRIDKKYKDNEKLVETDLCVASAIAEEVKALAASWTGEAISDNFERKVRIAYLLDESEACGFEIIEIYRQHLKRSGKFNDEQISAEIESVRIGIDNVKKFAASETAGRGLRLEGWSVSDIFNDSRNSSWHVEIPIHTVVPAGTPLDAHYEDEEFRVIEIETGERFLVSGYDEMKRLLLKARDDSASRMALCKIPVILTQYKGGLTSHEVKEILTGGRPLSWADLLENQNWIPDFIKALAEEAGRIDAEFEIAGNSTLRRRPHRYSRGDPFIRNIMRRERKKYPEFDMARVVENLISELEDSGPNAITYASFSPSYIFGNTGILTEKDVEELQRDPGRKMLSVGVGRAYLERYLVEELGIRREQVVLADQSEAHLPRGYERHVFDAFASWPDLGQQFDLIIFSESFFPPYPADLPLSDSEGRNKFCMKALLDIARRAMPFLKSGGEIRITRIQIERNPEEDRAGVLKRELESSGLGLDVEYTPNMAVIRPRSDAGKKER